MNLESYGDIWVCTDCYFAHHYGAHEIKPEDADERNPAGWYSGESDQPCEGGEPLGEIDDDFTVFDHTCSDHRYQQDDETDEDGEYVTPCDGCGSTDDEDGLIDFTWRSCDGCNSHLGGSRHRLSLWKETTDA